MGFKKIKRAMKREDLQNEIKILTFTKGKYYFIKNISSKLYLTVSK